MDKIKPVLNQVVDFIKRTPNMFAAFVLFLTLLVNPAAGNTSTCTLISETVFTMKDASYSNQGITTDGEYYYTSGSVSFAKYTALAKYDMRTMKRVSKKTFPVNWDLIKEGYDHIGGIAYYQGNIYAAMEAVNNSAPPCIAVFDADSLSYRYSEPLPASWFPNGIAWVAIDQFEGYLYTADSEDASSIHEFKIDATMAHVREIEVDAQTPMIDIEGGTFFNHKLYLSRDLDNGDTYDDVISVDLRTGYADVAFDREVGKADNAASDLTVFYAEDGSLFHVVDYDGILGVFIRNYIVDFD